jgi:CDP-diacylglycerol--serine O-phosphatidyltransferase
MLTLGNLACGFLAIAKASDAMTVPHVRGVAPPEEMLQLLSYAGWLIFLGMVFDALDGSVARMTAGTSAMGNILDSISDVVTFGLAPAFLAKCIAEGVGGMPDRKVTYWFSAFFALMAALRLARYSSHQADPEEANLWFDGLPTPGAAGVIAAISVLIYDKDFRPGPAVQDAVARFLPWATLALGLLMVSKFPYAHVTNRFLKGRKPVTYLVLGLGALVLFLGLEVFEAALAATLLCYALSGPLVAGIRRWSRRPPAAPDPDAPGPGGGVVGAQAGGRAGGRPGEERP